MHELRLNGQRYLLDCGLYQGRRKEARERNANLPFPAGSVSGVLLSHAHIDHSGNLPTLVKAGFTGPIHATAATTDLCRSMLPDSAHLQEKDAEFLAKRHHRRRALAVEDESEIVEPLYSMADAEHALGQFQEVELRKPVAIGPGITAEYFDAGHMLGSAALLLTLDQDGRQVRLAYSGDVGRPNLPIIRDPEPLPPVDYLIMESTYGNRIHDPLGEVETKLATAINRTCARGGRVIAPAFAVGRTQQLVLMLHELMLRDAIPAIPIFVDSPLAVNATEAFRKHTELFDSETTQFKNQHGDPFGFSRLRYIREVAESKALNDLHVPYIVISASGMCEAGRILHHLRNNIADPRNTVLVTGFMAENTLGRKIVERQQEVTIFGEPIRLRAEVVRLNELSGHADQNELLAWLEPMRANLRRVFIVHGEPAQQDAFAAILRERHKLDVVVPTRGEVIELR
jgi:metallo-beta-lactamase family protein